MALILSEPSFAGPRVSEANHEAATEAVIHNVDSFADWLGGECFERSNVDSDYALRLPHRLAEADSATVAHALLVSAQRSDAETTLQAAQLLLARYLAAMDRHVARRAGEYAAEPEGRFL